MVVFLILVSASACALAWWLAWRVTGEPGGAWFGWAARHLSAPFLLESFTVYPDAPGGVIVLTGVWALGRAAAESSEDTKKVAADHDGAKSANDTRNQEHAAVTDGDRVAVVRARRSRWRCCPGCTRGLRCSRRRSAA